MAAGPLFQTTQNDLISAVIEMEQLMLANSGEDPFEEILKLIVAKLYDESRVCEKPSTKSLFSDKGTGTEIKERVNSLLTRATASWEGILQHDSSIKLLPDHLALCIRPLMGVNLFHEDLTILDSAFEHLLTRSSKGSMGQYFTPRHVIDMCVDVLRPTVGQSVLDPACGSGGFLLHAWKYAQEHSTDLSPTGHVYGFDMDHRAIRIAHILNLLGAEGKLNIFQVNSLDGREWNPTIAAKLMADKRVCVPLTSGQDGWRILKGLQFDLILTNPPFAGRIADGGLLSHYAIGASNRTNGKSVDRDILFIERCLASLRRGGRMAIVLPQGVLCNENTKGVREWILENAKLIGVVGLHPATFLPHTGAKTSVLFLEKGHSSNTDDYPVLFACSEKPGKDTSGEFRYVTSDEGKAVIDHDLGFIGKILAEFLHHQPHSSFRLEKFGERSGETGWVRDNISVQPVSVVRRCGRFDAEFFKPHFVGAEKKLKARAAATIRDSVSTQIQRFKRQGTNEIAYFDISSVDSETGFAVPTEIPANEAPTRAQYLVRSGDVLVSTVRPDRNAVTLVRKCEKISVASNGFCVLRPQGVSSEYLFAFCKTETFRQLLSRYVAASMYPAVSDRDVLEMPFLLPDASTQKTVQKKVQAAFEKMEEARLLLSDAVNMVEGLLSKDATT
jgi:type I restriction enzyme M protein